MAKCVTCGKFTSTKGSATCGNIKCGNKYHLTCVGLLETARVGSDWRCSACKVKMPSDSVRHTSVKGAGSDESESTPSSAYDSSKSACGSATRDEEHTCQDQMVAQEIRLLRTDLLAMKDDLKAELREIRLEVADFRQSLATYRKKHDSLERRVEELERHREDASPEAVVGQLQSTVSQLKTELNEREQDLLLADMEITNLPECPGENVVHTVELVAKKLGVTLDERDIVFAERVGPRVEQPATDADGAKGRGVGVRGRKIVVRLNRRGVRDEFLRSARVRRGADSADLGFDAPPRRFYINERLTNK